ncbi:MAG: dihydroorotase [Chlamydiales bacterium]|nr:dihydroorotase [Chlamydiales bacterium]
MIEIKNARTIDGKTIDKQIPSSEHRVIDASGLTLFPGLIDPHVHFRTPGLEHKENWMSGARAAIRGGITTVFDMPNTQPPTTTRERLLEKKQLIDKQLQEVDIPLRYQLYFGADKNHFDEIHKCKPDIVAIKVFMGSSTGELLMDDDSSLHAIFSLAKSLDLMVAVHAEDEALIHQRKELFVGQTAPETHSKLRSRDVAIRATQHAIALAQLYHTRLYILHVSTKEEVELIAQAKKEKVNVFAETTPHHLFLTEESYKKFGTKVQMNPPIRTQEDCEGLWRGILQGAIDTIGSDHAPHTLEEKSKPYGLAPSGIPGIETTLPLLLDAHHKGRLSLPQIVRLMRERILEIFRLPSNDDFVLVDLAKVKTVKDEELKTRAGWSPYAGWELKGWPVYTIVKGRVYESG